MLRPHSITHLPVLALTLGLLTGCGDVQKPSPDVWAGAANSQGTGRSPELPAKLVDWVADGPAETYSARAFDNVWEPATGSSGGFPAGGNTCVGKHLVKWRSTTPGVTVQASWQYPRNVASEESPVNKPADKPVTADRGWMILDSCQEPIFKFGAADTEGVNLVDVVAVARRYSAAP